MLTTLLRGHQSITVTAIAYFMSRKKNLKTLMFFFFFITRFFKTRTKGLSLPSNEDSNTRHIKFCKQNTAMLIVLREN